MFEIYINTCLYIYLTISAMQRSFLNINLMVGAADVFIKKVEQKENVVKKKDQYFVG